jgi:hypothetical protein
MRKLTSGSVTSSSQVAGKPKERFHWYIDVPSVTAMKVHAAKLTTHISQKRLPPGVLGLAVSPISSDAFRRGRRSSSPPHREQLPWLLNAHSGQ